MTAALSDPGNKLWVFLQQGVCRALIALKFLILARLLGPEAIGLLVVALIALAAVEALTETGLSAALIQRETTLSEAQTRAIWTILLIRGLVISVAIVVLADRVASILGVPDAAQLVLLIGLVPMLRSSASIGISIAQRERQFRPVALLQVLTSGSDLAISVSLVVVTGEIVYAAVGLLVSELVRTVVSHFLFSTRPVPTLRLGPASVFIGFGKWVWGTTMINFVLDQADKIMVANFLGQASLGLYQIVQKVARLFTVDVAHAANQYLFPVLSQHNRQNRQKLEAGFATVLQLVATLFLLTAFCLFLLAPWLIQTLLGPEWISGVDAFRILCFGAAASAIALPMAAYARAIGSPQKVTHAAALQAAIFLPSAWWASRYYGLEGVAVCWTAAFAVRGGWLTISLGMLSAANLRRMKSSAPVLAAGIALMLAAYWTLEDRILQVFGIGLVYGVGMYLTYRQIARFRLA